jgi:multiple sugar transport system ATP-binding protein
MAKVVLKNLFKTYPERNGNGVTAVNGIDLTVEDREFMVLVGPSGCGKSTTLRMIAGLEEISDGIISIDGRVVNNIPPKDRDIAMVFQNYALYPHMTVYENLAFGLKLGKIPRDEIKTRVVETAGMLGLEAYLDRKPKALSGGQRQRVAVGRAIIRKPKVFLFDEPLSNLDAKMRLSMRAEISKLHARLGATTIYVTHDQEEAMTMGNRICVMKHGDVQQIAEPLVLYPQPANLFVAGFIGSPPMNFFKGRIQFADGRLWFMETSPDGDALILPLMETLSKCAAGHDGKAVILGVRAEAINDARALSTVDPALVVEVKVEIVEPMGAETFLHLRTGTTLFVARVSAAVQVQADQRLKVAFDLDRARLFDAATEKVLD